MRRTKLLQEIRTMRFEEAFTGWQEHCLTQEEAACMLGVHERTFRRYIDHYEEDREACLQAGMNDFIAKPVNPNNLFEMIGKWSAGKTKAEQSFEPRIT